MNAIDLNLAHYKKMLDKIEHKIDLALGEVLFNKKLSVQTGNVGPLSQKIMTIIEELSHDIEYMDSVISSKGCLAFQWEIIVEKAIHLFSEMDKSCIDDTDPAIEDAASKIKEILKIQKDPGSMTQQLMKQKNQLKTMQQISRSDIITKPKIHISDPYTSGVILLAILFDIYKIKLWRKS